MADVPDAQGVDCTWLTTPLGGRQRGAAITVPCDTPVALEVPYPAGARVSVEVGGRQIAETTARIKDLLIVGFGDSFGSGEGNPEFATVMKVIKALGLRLSAHSTQT